MTEASTDNAEPSGPITFHTTLLQTGKTTTGIEVPAEVIGKLAAGRQPLVRVTLNGYTYRSAVAVRNDRFLVSMSAANRRAAGVEGGEAITVTIEVDREPRTVTVPDDLEDALKEAGAWEAFESAAPSRRKEYVRQVVSAKAQATRERRIAKIVSTLSDT